MYMWDDGGESGSGPNGREGTADLAMLGGWCALGGYPCSGGREDTACMRRVVGWGSEQLTKESLGNR